MLLDPSDPHPPGFESSQRLLAESFEFTFILAAPIEIINCDPGVANLAKKLANCETDHSKVTAAVFNHIRDKIRFGFDLVQVKASETLARGYGVCWNEALLLVAPLRSNRIRARMANNPVRREFMRPAMGDGCLSLPETINHCFIQVHLNDQWTMVDVTLDQSTYEKLFVPTQVTGGIDWNGSVMPPPSEAAAVFKLTN
jgi:transglutaminase-like putative cysteine protease